MEISIIDQVLRQTPNDILAMVKMLGLPYPIVTRNYVYFISSNYKELCRYAITQWNYRAGYRIVFAGTNKLDQALEILYDRFTPRVNGKPIKVS